MDHLAGKTTQAAGDRPLAAVRVIDAVPGAMATIARYLADLGAEVIRIEPREGAVDRRRGRICAGVSLDFVAANLGKHATTPDRLPALAAEADIAIVERGSVDIAALRQANPALVVLSVSDFGDTGRFAHWAGSDAVFQALSGTLSRSGIPGRTPLLPPGDLGVACATAQGAYLAVLAYWRALQTGQGDHLDFSVLDGAAQVLDPGYGISGSAAGGVLANKLPRGRPDVRFMYPILTCRDGFVRVCVLAPRQWQGLFEWMGRPEEFADPSFNEMPVRFASKTLLPAMARLFAERTRREAEEEGQRFGVPVASVLEADEVLANEQIVARGAFREVDVAPGVAAPFPDGVLSIDGVCMGFTGPAPALPQSGIGWAPRSAPPPAGTKGGHPFTGLKVLDFGVIVVGAETSRLLADQGADVVKVESAAFVDGSRQSRHPGPISPTFATGHRNKRSLGLNLRSPEAKPLLHELIRQADIVLSNFKGGTLESLGLDYETLKAINPRIIVTDSTAFGSTGPWARRMGYGPLVRASAGLTVQWRYPDDPTSFSDSITVYPDHVAGRIGAIGVIASLIRRSRTGLGGQVSVSQAEVMLSHMAPRIAAGVLTGKGLGVVEALPRSQVHAAAGDDEWCVVTSRDAADEQVLDRVTQGDVGGWIASRPPREAMETLQAAGVPAAAMLRVSELPTFDYYIERDFFRDAHHPHISERLTMEAAPVRAQRLPDPPASPAPLMAEHTVELATEWLGLSDTQIEELIAAGALERAAS